MCRSSVHRRFPCRGLSAMHHVYLRGAVVLRRDLVDRYGAAPRE
jgi:chorismate mutase